MTIGPPIPEIQFDFENSRSKVKVKGTLFSIASSWLISFWFHINWTNQSEDMANTCRMFEWGKQDLKFYEKKLLKNIFLSRIPPKLNQLGSMMRGIYLSSFIVNGRAVLTLSWGQGKLCPALVAYWPWPKVTEIGARKIFHTHRSTMCGLKKLASGVFPESWKVLAEWRRPQWRRWRRKRTKNN